jgi:hypothetical protein
MLHRSLAIATLPDSRWTRYVVRRLGRSLLTIGLVLFLLPWVFLDHGILDEWPAETYLLVPRALPPLSTDEKRASEAVLSYRACPDGPSIAQLIDAALSHGRIGTIHARSGTIVAESAPGLYQVDIVTETLDSGRYGSPSRSEHRIAFTYDARTSRVTGRDAGGVRYLESVRWECVREISPWRRGPPQPVDHAPG